MRRLNEELGENSIDTCMMKMIKIARVGVFQLGRLSEMLDGDVRHKQRHNDDVRWCGGGG